MANRPTIDAASLRRQRISIPLLRPLWILLAAILPLACDNNPEPAKKPAVEKAVVPDADGGSSEPPSAISAADKTKATNPVVANVVAETPVGVSQSSRELNADQEREIRGLVEQLVFAEREAVEEPLINPDFVGEDDLHGEEEEVYRKRFAACQRAFQRLKELKEAAFPILVEHLKDERQSIPFRNHVLGQSVGDACYWNIYFQLQDMPKAYSSYGYGRMGRDGQDHEKPYWNGTPFDEAGGVAEWLDENKALSYTEKQIKCLRWLLEKEKAIGACDAEGYFENILPLEIRIAERRLEAGEDVQPELERLRLIRDEKRVAEIPRELLPDADVALKLRAAERDDRARNADVALKRALNLLASGRKDRAHRRLKELIERFPDTDAAAEAQELLEK